MPNARALLDSIMENENLSRLMGYLSQLGIPFTQPEHSTLENAVLDLHGDFEGTCILGGFTRPHFSTRLADGRLRQTGINETDPERFRASLVAHRQSVDAINSGSGV